ncbi:hypothetical protein Patl1_10079 [Pistacia atlantica]|uniref:Uncharacterized protein n=1 Tax=Pistacia atlantica TaxID=434234 RepID=A0ACC1A8Z3_9ROSI|nr:hypothetical protein Patl1_10079 [Pistacia atlantica]
MDFLLLLSSLTPRTLTQYFSSFLALLFLIHQITYWIKKGRAPGPVFVLPFIGNAIPLVRNPTKFWEEQAVIAKPLGFSANYLIGNFMVFIRNTELSHRIFSNVRPDAFMLVGHPFGKKLFGEHNLIYMFGQDHKDLRGRIAPNFTVRALSTYTSLQQIIILKHLKKWVKLSNSDVSQKLITLRLLVRDMNLETSQTVIVGPYLNEEARRKFNYDYNLFNVGTMKFPVDLPGFAFRNARLAVQRLVDTLTLCTQQSKARMAKGEEPSCLIDFWMQEHIKELAAAKAAGKPPPPHSGDHEIAGHLFDFLFAAQDASTSSLLWAVSLLDSHPEVLSKVRNEVLNFWSPESDEMITADQGFTEPDRFDPDRFSEERREDQVYKRNFLVFGAGAHQCVGQRYALNHLVLFIAMFATLIDFKRLRTDGCDEIVYNPTISPKDGCKVYLFRRCSRYPNLSFD